jgi:ABC-type Na+ efflux pump permease subunit
MNWRAVRAIAGKDLLALRQAKAVLIPLIVVPVLFLVLLPLLASFAPAALDTPGANDLRDLLESLPASLEARLVGYSDEQRLVVILLTYLFAPIYLILPLMVASVIAADAFAGERERRTLEALIYTPTSDRELLLGKLLAGFIPAVAVAWLGLIVYSLVANLAAWPVMGAIFLPNGMWALLAIYVAPGVAALGLGATVLVSLRVNTFQEAYQVGALVVLPLIVLVVGQAAGVVVLSPIFVLGLGTVVWLLALALLAWGARGFRRAELMARG